MARLVLRLPFALPSSLLSRADRVQRRVTLFSGHFVCLVIVIAYYRSLVISEGEDAPPMVHIGAQQALSTRGVAVCNASANSVHIHLSF